MTEEEFLEKRKQFYLDSDTLLVKFPTSRHFKCNHAVWFSEMGYAYNFAIRGYLWETENHENDFIMLYWNNFAIPNITCNVFWYLFQYFPHIKWIGLGCYIDKPGEIWKPQLTVYRTDI